VVRPLFTLWAVERNVARWPRCGWWAAAAALPPTVVTRPPERRCRRARAARRRGGPSLHRAPGRAGAMQALDVLHRPQQMTGIARVRVEIVVHAGSPGLVVLGMSPSYLKPYPVCRHARFERWRLWWPMGLAARRAWRRRPPAGTGRGGPCAVTPRPESVFMPLPGTPARDAAVEHRVTDHGVRGGSTKIPR